MVRITRMTKKRLGELLSDEGLVNEEQIQEALRAQRKTGELLGEVLVRLEYVSEVDIAQTIVTQFGLPYIAVKQYYVTDDVMAVFPEQLMRKYQFVPLDKIGNIITIAVGGLINFDVLTELETTSKGRIQVFVSTWSEIKSAIDAQFKPSGKGTGGAKPEAGPAPAEEPSITESAVQKVVAQMEAGQPAEEEGGDAKEDSSLTELGSMLLGDDNPDGGGA